MDSKLFLAIFLGIWLGMTVYYVTKLFINAGLTAADKWAYKKVKTISVQEKKDNNTGRIIGFRPIENERA